MNLLKYTSYLYLAFGIYFIYDGYTKIGTNQTPWLSFIIAALAIFMFFFRLRYSKKFEDRNKQP